MGVVIGRGSGRGTADGARSCGLAPRLGLSLKVGVAASETRTIDALGKELFLNTSVSYLNSVFLVYLLKGDSLKSSDYYWPVAHPLLYFLVPK